MVSKSKYLILAVRIYSFFLYAYPAPFRRQFGAEMAQVFRDDSRTTLQSGGKTALAGLWFLAFFDLLKTAATEHIWELFHMSTSNPFRWSGLAAAIGYPLFILSFLSQGFWQVIQLIGIADNDYIHPLLAEIGLLLAAFGLAGLYRRLPARTRPLNELFLGLSLIGILLTMVATLSLVLPIPDSYLVGAILLTWLAVAGMGVIALFSKALGVFSFIPLLLVVSGIAFALTAESNDSLFMFFFTIHIFCWPLLGVALWMEPEPAPDPVTPA